MNPLAKHLLLTTLKSQTQRAINKAFPNNDYGKFQKMNFECLSPTDVDHTLTFENYSSKVKLSSEGIKDFEKKLNVNLTEAFKPTDNKQPVKKILAYLDCVSKKMAVRWLYEDGTFNDLNF